MMCYCSTEAIKILTSIFRPYHMENHGWLHLYHKQNSNCYQTNYLFWKLHSHHRFSVLNLCTCLILFTLVSIPAGTIGSLLGDGHNGYLMHRHASSAQDCGIPRCLQPTEDNRLTPSWGSAWKQRIWPAPEFVHALLQTHAWNQVKYPGWNLRLKLLLRNIQRAGHHIPKKSWSQPLSFYLCDLWQRERNRKSSFKFYSTWELQWCLSL